MLKWFVMAEGRYVIAESFDLHWFPGIPPPPENVHGMLTTIGWSSLANELQATLLIKWQPTTHKSTNNYLVVDIQRSISLRSFYNN